MWPLVWCLMRWWIRQAVVSDAAAGGVDLLGPDGVLAELTKRILERALAEEMTDHLGYESGDPIGHGTGNNRNGTSPKQVLTEIGAVDLDIPRDRNATFEPRIVPKGARRLERFNSNIVALYARGLSTRDIRLELKRMYGVDVSPALVQGHRRCPRSPTGSSRGGWKELTDWVQNRPLDPDAIGCYPMSVHRMPKKRWVAQGPVPGGTDVGVSTAQHRT